MNEKDMEEIFIEWVRNQEIQLKKTIESHESVLEILKKKLDIILELKEMEKYGGERFMTIVERLISLESELKKKTLEEMKEFEKSLKITIPDFYR